MDRHLRRAGVRANLVALATPARAEVLASAPMHISAGLRRVLNGLGHAVDAVIYSGWREVEIKAPLFIVAPARSGTTMLFHQLAADPRFAATKLGNTLIRPISANRLLRRMAAKERRLILAARDGLNKTMSAIDDTHVLRIDRLEEDEGFFNDHYGLFNTHLLFPTVHERLGLTDLDDRSPRSQRGVMREYERFIRRFLYLAGPERTYLCKNVHHAGRIACLERSFPDARYIHIVRDPLVQLPSALELIRTVAEASHGRAKPRDDPYWKLVAAALLDHQRKLLAWERKIPSSRWLTLRYSALIGDPAATVRSIYAHFGIPMDPAQDPALAAANERAQSFRKRRRYSLEDYEIDPNYVREQLSAVWDAYGLET